MLRRLSAAAARAARCSPPASPAARAAAPPPSHALSPVAAAPRQCSAAHAASPAARLAALTRGHAVLPSPPLPQHAVERALRGFAAAASSTGGGSAARPVAPPAFPPASASPTHPSHNGVAWLQALQVEASSPGRATLTAIPRRALCAETGLALRDLRVVDPSFRGQLPAVLVRRGAIVMSLEHVKAVITANRVLLFDALNPSVKQFVPDLLRALSEGEACAEAQHGAEVAHSAEAGGSAALPPFTAAPAGAWLEPADTPFEFRALAAALDSVCTRLELRSRALAPEVQSVVSALQADAGAAAARRHVPLALVRLNTELARLAADVEDVRGALAELLAADEDMAALYLTAPRSSAAEHAEAEVLLEAYFRAVEEAASEVAALRDALRFTEGYLNTALDASRNALLRLDTLLTLGTLSLAAGGVVAAAFGMNLQSGLEASPHAFAAACGAAATTSAAVFAAVWATARSTLRAV